MPAFSDQTAPRGCWAGFLPGYREWAGPGAVTTAVDQARGRREQVRCPAAQAWPLIAPALKPQRVFKILNLSHITLLLFPFSISLA